MRGYSVIELVVVIAVLGILAAVAAPRFFARDVFAERGYADELADAIRQAQRTATVTGCPVEVRVTTAGLQARLPQASAGHCASLAASTWTTPIRRSDGGTLDAAPPSGVSIVGSARVVFDFDGRASNGSAITIQVGGRTVSIAAITGRVAVT